MRAKGLIALAVLALSLGCGNKLPPAPQGGADIFAFESAEAMRQDRCVLIQATLQGALDNVAGFSLLIEEDPCSGCPFSPQQRQEFRLDDAQVLLEGSILNLTQCGLDTGSAYRLQLLGNSRLRNMPPARTQLLNLTP